MALIPINGRDWFREQRQIIGNTDYREAADLGHAIGADVIVPTHFDMFAGNPGHPGLFVDYCTGRGGLDTGRGGLRWCRWRCGG
ncbi:MAG: hypothetical protein HY332_06330 [Chloroflexi bacterium]|nr:hypothetical protein [Chloroflexota bacterium]